MTPCPMESRFRIVGHVLILSCQEHLGRLVDERVAECGAAYVEHAKQGGRPCHWGWKAGFSVVDGTKEVR